MHRSPCDECSRRQKCETEKHGIPRDFSTNRRNDELTWLCEDERPTASGNAHTNGEHLFVVDGIWKIVHFTVTIGALEEVTKKRGVCRVFELLCAQLTFERCSLRRVNDGVGRRHDDAAATADEIRVRASLARTFAHQRLNRTQRAIRRADTAELPIDNDRMRLLDDQLSVVHIRLGDERF